MRQYDDDMTKFYNQKPNYEDFNLGVFFEDQKKIFEQGRTSPQVLPTKYDLAILYSHLFVADPFRNVTYIGLTEFEES